MNENGASDSKVYHTLTRKEVHDSLVGDDGARSQTEVGQ